MAEEKTLKDLLENGVVSIAQLPQGNMLPNLDVLDKLDGYTVPLIAHDYGAKTPVMWNSIYKQQGLNLRNIMVVGNPEHSERILEALRQDPKYLGGGAGVGFKESVVPYIQTVPKDLQAVNIIINKQGTLIGRNTDAEGFVRSLEEKLSHTGKTVKGANIVVYGAGGVAKEVTKLLAERQANHLRIVNRTYAKAVKLASQLNDAYGQIAVGLGEDMSRGVVLNSEIKVDVLINTTDKGSDGKLIDVAMYEGAHEYNETLSRVILRELKQLRPDVVIADIVLPSTEESVSLRLAKQAGIEHLLDGKPMVIYQAIPAYQYVEQANSQVHNKQVTEEELLDTFTKAAHQDS